MLRIAIATIALGACSFQPGAGPDDGNVIAVHDAALHDSRGGALPDTTTPPPPCTPGFVDLCSMSPPTVPFTIAMNDSIDTDTDPRCTVVTLASGRMICVVNATTVSIANGATLTATGSLPLVLRAMSTLDVEGTIDAGSVIGGRTGPAANDSSCTLAAQAEDDLGGAAGGAGGSFNGVGGAGGTGDTDDSLGGDGTAAPGEPGPTSALPTSLRGGCPGGKGGNESAGGGQGGAAGAGGGALYLVAAQTVTIGGRVRVAGAGGPGGQTQAGGGGGGGGGFIVIESATITITGTITANGGGGGEGGGRINGNDTTGNPGADGDYGTTAAAGGSGLFAVLGYGGAGAASSGAVAGSSSIVGAGGGGGAVGFIHLLGAGTISGVVSPPAS